MTENWGVFPYVHVYMYTGEWQTEALGQGARECLLPEETPCTSNSAEAAGNGTARLLSLDFPCFIS